jgi:hypothetical protein
MVTYMYLEGILNTWNTMDPAIYCAKHNTVSTVAFNVHLFNFQVPVQSVPITTKVVNSNPAHDEV